MLNTLSLKTARRIASALLGAGFAVILGGMSCYREVAMPVIVDPIEDDRSSELIGKMYKVFVACQMIRLKEYLNPLRTRLWQLQRENSCHTKAIVWTSLKKQVELISAYDMRCRLRATARTPDIPSEGDRAACSNAADLRDSFLIWRKEHITYVERRKPGRFDRKCH